MEESAFPFNSKDKKAKKLWMRRQHVDDIKSETSNNETCKQKAKGKSGWKSFINLFVKSSSDRINRKGYGSKRETKQTKQPEKVELFLNDIKDDFAMAISLPEEIKGKDVQVSIEMKAIGKQDIDSMSHQEGLNIVKDTSSNTTFSGNIKIPTETTIEGISKMPLYFVSTNSNGEYPQKIETVIKPMADNLPLDIDRNMIVGDINLKVNLQNVSQRKYKDQIKQKSLQYVFITNKNLESKVQSNSQLQIKTQPSSKSNLPSQSGDIGLCKSELQSHTEEIVEKISQEKHDYGEETKAIVKEILSQVVLKVQTQDTSTQYVDIVSKVNKEIDVQRSLLLRINSEKDVAVKDSKLQPYLSRISERDEDCSCITGTSEESLYPRSTSCTHHDSTSMPSSDGSFLCIKAPNTHHKPRFVIKYDNLFGTEKKYRKHNEYSLKATVPNLYEDRNSVNYISIADSKRLKWTNNKNVLSDVMRADIDKTLELLETAKHKLLGYLDRPFNLNECNNFKKCEYLSRESTAASDIETLSSTQNSLEQEVYNRYLKEMRSTRRKSTFDEDKRFFLGNSKNEETLSIIEIPNTDIVLYRSQTQVDNDRVLEERYSGRSEQELVYSVVEVDIRTMISDLLAESENIKHIINENLDPNYNLATIVDEEIKHTTNNSSTIEIQDNLIEDLDPPNCQTPIHLQYCIIDSEIKGDPSKALLDIEQKGPIFPNAKCKIPKTSWNFGEARCQLPTVTVKRFCPTKHHSNFQTSNDLIHNVEKGSVFLKEICEEICTVTLMSDDDPKKLSEVQPSTSTEGVSEVSAPEPSEFFPVNEPKFLLKRAGKLAGYEENVTQAQNLQPPQSSLDEVIAITSPVIPQTTSKHFISPARYSSSSSEDVEIPRKRTKAPVKKEGVKYENSTSAYTLCDTDYEADTENASNLLVLPLLREDYVSIQDFNNQDEIAYIEENLKRNDELNVIEEDVKLKKGKKPFIYRSEESFEITSLTSSDCSLELSKPFENN